MRARRFPGVHVPTLKTIRRQCQGVVSEAVEVVLVAYPVEDRRIDTATTCDDLQDTRLIVENAGDIRIS